jgi:hypothetical protein
MTVLDSEATLLNLVKFRMFGLVGLVWLFFFTYQASIVAQALFSIQPLHFPPSLIAAFQRQVLFQANQK